MNKQTHVRFDWAMKKILRSKANFGILEGFLSELLEKDIKILNLLESESNRETEEDKCNRVDINVMDSNGELYLVEIQNSRELDYFYRILYNTSKAISENMEKGAKYKEVKKVITVSIIYFDLGQGLDYIYHGVTRFNGRRYKDELQLSESQKRLFSRSTVEEIFPDHYLIKVNNFDDMALDTMDEWVYFLKNSEIKDEFKAKGLEEAREKLREINMTPEERANYLHYVDNLSLEASLADTIKWEKQFEREEGIEVGIQIGREEGLQKGREEGEKKKALEIARALKENGMDINIICISTGLSKELIETL